MANGITHFLGRRREKRRGARPSRSDRINERGIVVDLVELRRAVDALGHLPFLKDVLRRGLQHLFAGLAGQPCIENLFFEDRRHAVMELRHPAAWLVNEDRARIDILAGPPILPHVPKTGKANDLFVLPREIMRLAVRLRAGPLVEPARGG